MKGNKRLPDEIHQMKESTKEVKCHSLYYSRATQNVLRVIGKVFEHLNYIKAHTI